MLSALSCSVAMCERAISRFELPECFPIYQQVRRIVKLAHRERESVMSI